MKCTELCPGRLGHRWVPTMGSFEAGPDTPCGIWATFGLTAENVRAFLLAQGRFPVQIRENAKCTELCSGGGAAPRAPAPVQPAGSRVRAGEIWATFR